MKNLFYILLIFTTTSLITSCDKDDDPVIVAGCMDSTANNYNVDATEDDGSCTFDVSVAPESYIFMRDGVSTVAYDGQKCRVNQAAELMNNAFTNPANAGMLDEMIQSGTGFSISYCTDQTIGNKIAASAESMVELGFDGDIAGSSMFQTWMNVIIDDLESNVFPAWDSPASVGIAGVIGGRHVNAHGLEPNQAFTKGLIGAMCLDQITNKYTHPDYQASQDNTPGDGYTDMEHTWDEGMGYLFGMDQLANVSGLSYSASGDVLLLKYAYKIGDDVVEDLYDLFIEGRHAIVIEDYITRDEAAVEIKEILDGIIMQKSVDYLRGGAEGITAAMNCVEDDTGATVVAQQWDPTFSGGCAEAVPFFIGAGYACDTDLGVLGIPGISGTITDMCSCSCNADDAWADIFHDLSEGYGFVLSLQFTDAFTHDDVMGMKATLDNVDGNGFWGIDPSDLNAMADQIETAM